MDLQTTNTNPLQYLSARPMFMLVYIRMCSPPPSSVTQASDSSMQVPPSSLWSHFFTKSFISSEDAAHNSFSQYFFTKDPFRAMFYPHKPSLIYHQTPNTKWMSLSLNLKQPLHHLLFHIQFHYLRSPLFCVPSPASLSMSRPSPWHLPMPP